MERQLEATPEAGNIDPIPTTAATHEVHSSVATSSVNNTERLEEATVLQDQSLTARPGFSPKPSRPAASARFSVLTKSG